jgi:hypothetical protein
MERIVFLFRTVVLHCLSFILLLKIARGCTCITSFMAILDNLYSKKVNYFVKLLK